MNKYYTTKQVQELFKVDRITVYRMLQDGRLKGVKIGKQWRFPEQEIERLLGGETAAADMDPDVDSAFPVHCVQTIQDLFSSVSRISAVIIDQQGNPVTEISQHCKFCSLVMESTEGRLACSRSWREFAQSGNVKNATFTCHAGINYVGTTITHDGEPQGMFLMGEVFLAEEGQVETKRQLNHLARMYGLSVEKLERSMREIPLLTEAEKMHLQKQPAAAACAVESILHERGVFLKRLQEIANLTQNI